MSRRFVGCNRCNAGAWIGPAGTMHDAWCEACQRAARIPAGTEAPPCEACGGPLTLGEPRFEELFGELQNLVAVLEAWNRDPTRLTPLVPERPRFLADLDPPEAVESDPGEVRAALAALRAGDFAGARERLATLVGDDARLWRALGVARQRLGDLAGAEQAFAHALAIDPADLRARLDRGTLLARRSDFAGARSDLERAGDGPEGRWNRAALRVLEAVATGTGLPPAEILRQARAEAGPASSYWSDPTVGRLLFTLLVERARARGADACADARTLRAAEAELEFDTFDDRALALIGYASLGLAADASRVAAPLAARLIAEIEAEPFVRGPAGAWLASALEVAEREIAASAPAEALAATTPLLERGDLRHYRIPCVHCGEGTLGVERVEEEEPITEPLVSRER